jgi:hypothetical protein
VSQEVVRIVVPEAHYTLFDATRDGLPEVVVVNDALLSFPDLAIFPWYLRITLEARELIENGMPSPAESDLLFQIGDELEALVLATKTTHGSVNALFLARSTWNEERDLLFQVHDPEIVHTELQAALNSRKWSRPWEYSMKEDPELVEAGYLFQLFSRARGLDA